MNSFFHKNWLALALTIVILAVTGTAAATHKLWLPQVRQWVTSSSDTHEDEAGHGHAHPHPHPQDDQHAHNEAEALELSAEALKNIGLETSVIKPGDYVKTTPVPAIVVERPGRSQIDITTPLTGIVTRIYPIRGEAIQPGQPLFDLRLTHEDLVTAQRNFLQSAQEMDVIQSEINRLKSAGDGVIPGRRILEQQYELQKTKAALHAQRQGLLLHGLTDKQIDGILDTRKLLPSLTVSAPEFDKDADHHDVKHLYHVQSVVVKRGQSVAAGETLGVLADHCLLYVEGQAFEDDSERLIQAAQQGWEVEVASGVDHHNVSKLRVLNVADQVDRDTRALRFYLSLPNSLVRDEKDGGHRFVAWKYRPGQRMEVRFPLGKSWTNQIVLPPTAVIFEGADAYVFEQNGDHFDRVGVHVLYRDKNAVVVHNDGKLVGSTLATSGAYQMQLAMKNKSGGAVDPHAGHSH